MTLEQKAADMRAAIDAMELAMMGFGDIVDLPDKWGEPRHRDEVGVSLPVTAGQVYRVTDALAELTRIINSDEYGVANANMAQDECTITISEISGKLEIIGSIPDHMKKTVAEGLTHALMAQSTKIMNDVLGQDQKVEAISSH